MIGMPTHGQNRFQMIPPLARYAFFQHHLRLRRHVDVTSVPLNGLKVYRIFMLSLLVASNAFRPTRLPALLIAEMNEKLF
ncbi:hypothetical protein P6U16_00565 [Rhizobium sp. 32-5/1]|uniref:hypothetical protein n=1 Tax=Rhizobium sp. 32-5/1 TaxID=3019602 RepID=UPI00240D22F9|nr:hypothetical protein [Rhizobium sp. 32-5/1]WEZ83423.1 hypothetical protein P6U16_00565 [Rhizobium sp. 32-5/1]